MSAIQRNLELYHSNSCCRDKSSKTDLKKIDNSHGNLGLKVIDEASLHFPDSTCNILTLKQNNEQNEITSDKSVVNVVAMETERSCTEGEVERGERSQLDQEKDYCVKCFFMRYNIRPLAGNARIMKQRKVLP